MRHDEYRARWNPQARIWELLNSPNSHGRRRVIASSVEPYPDAIPTIGWSEDFAPVHLGSWGSIHSEP
jgi:hypothetical protein